VANSELRFTAGLKLAIRRQRARCPLAPQPGWLCYTRARGNSPLQCRMLTAWSTGGYPM